MLVDAFGKHVLCAKTIGGWTATSGKIFKNFFTDYAELFVIQNLYFFFSYILQNNVVIFFFY